LSHTATFSGDIAPVTRTGTRSKALARDNLLGRDLILKPNARFDLGIALGIALAGFAAGYGAREIVSYRRRKAALMRHHELGLDY